MGSCLLARKAFKSLQNDGPITVHDSLPLGNDSMETMVMPESDLQSMSERFDQIVEEPNLDFATKPVTLTLLCGVHQFFCQ